MRSQLLALIIGAVLLAGAAFSQTTKAGQPTTKAATPGGQKSVSSEPFAVSGRVVDWNGDPMSGVTVNAGGGKVATSDNYGEYMIRGLDRGKPEYILRASKAPYKFNPESAKVYSPRERDAKGPRFEAVGKKK